ncbi:MAG: alpha/beta fold hydrolase [Acidimicrobiia bacterium]
MRAFGDGSLFGEVSGDGPARVLALHGWGRRGIDFAQSLQGISYIALDLPGFGATPAPAAAMGAQGYAQAIESVLVDCPAPIVLVGHSFGGRVAVHLAASHPDRVSGLILTGVPLLKRKVSTGSSPVFRMARWAAGRGLVPSSVIESMRRRYGSSDYRAARGVMRDVLVIAVNESYERELEALRVPIELLWGAEDREVPVVIAERAADLLAVGGHDVNLVVEAGVGHLLPVTAPQALRRSVEAMINR